MTNTQERFLDAAERVFIRTGYEGASIRPIAAEARGHLSALHHYWGNKEELFRAVCRRRFGPIHERQCEGLRECAAALDVGLGVPVEVLVRALIEPPILHGGATPEERETTRRMYGRALLEPSPVFMGILKEVIFEASALFNALMYRLHPGLGPQRFYWRFNCALGAIIVSHSYGERVGEFFGRRPGATHWPAVVDEIAAFVAAGMMASSPGTVVPA